MGDTDISWANKVWNVTRGCRRVSAGCEHCYAERQANRFAGKGQPYEGLIRIGANGPRWSGQGTFVSDKLSEPFSWRKPARIFVNSMSDLFYDAFTFHQIAAVFGVIAACPQHTFQILTKRPERARAWFEWLASQCNVATSATEFLVESIYEAAPSFTALDKFVVRGKPFPLPNAWIGTSVESQDVDHRIDELMHCPAAVRFLSLEPLLSAIDLQPWLDPTGACDCPPDHSYCKGGCAKRRSWRGSETPPGSEVAVDPSLHWVIAGCESGPGARDYKIDWLRDLRDQCSGADIAFFLKQAKVVEETEISNGRRRTKQALRAGKGSTTKSGGVIELPYLDGKQHAAFPPSRTA